MSTTDNTERFSNRVDNYVRYRPHYPAAIIPFLVEAIGLNKNWLVADIGSGTGISCELFLQNGNVVYGVEPNANMRQAAEAGFAANKNFVSINGTAEQTTLADNSVDLVIAAQAFHWFNASVAKQEIKRIAKPNTYVALIWNERDTNTEFLKRYDQLLFKYATDYASLNHRNVADDKIAAFFSPAKYEVREFDNIQQFTFDDLTGRLLSSSYAPLPGSDKYQPMMDELQLLFDQFKIDNKIDFNYRCKIYYAPVNHEKNNQ